MAKKELSIDEHNEAVFAEIKELEAKIADLKKTVKAETLKPQATLQECLNMAKKAAKPKVAKDKVKPKTDSL